MFKTAPRQLQVQLQLTPNETQVNGHLRISSTFDLICDSISVQLIWQLVSAQACETQVIAEIPLIYRQVSVDSLLESDFDFELPTQPRHFQGALIRVEWGVRVKFVPRAHPTAPIYALKTFQRR
jgi:hypothetical protein